MPPETQLPIVPLKTAFLEALDRGPVVLTAPTGSGKSTRVPLWCAENRGRILVVEPRRVACRALYRYVHNLQKTDPSHKVGAVGYMVRHEKAHAEKAHVLYVTPGVALRLLAEGSRRADDRLTVNSSDSTSPKDFLKNGLCGFETVIIDEFHERGLENDLLLAFLKEFNKWKTLEKKKELAGLEREKAITRTVIMSATIDVHRLAKWLDATPFKGEGRQYPVDVKYLKGKRIPSVPSIRGLEERVVVGVRQALNVTNEGDILVFLPGKGEIRKSRHEVSNALGIETLELHAGLPPRQQDRAFSPSKERRVLLATNVAESSVTLPWVRAVVDSGLERRTNYRHTRSVLSLMPISQESARQRTGRAGRLGPGIAIRLWDEKGVLRPSTPPEILREDLDSLVLKAATLGRTLESLDFLDSPDEKAVDAARDRLTKMGLLDTSGLLTKEGYEAAKYPVDPMLSRLLVEAIQAVKQGAPQSLLNDSVDLVASLSVQGRLFSQGPKRHLHSTSKKRGRRTNHRKNHSENRLPSEPLYGFSQEETEKLESINCDGVARILAIRGDGPVVKLAHGGRIAEARRIRDQILSLIHTPKMDGKKNSRHSFPTQKRSQPIHQRALAKLAIRAAPHCAFVRRGHCFGGSGMEVGLSPDSFVDPQALAVAVLDTHSTRTKGFRATHVATCCLPLSSKDIATQGLGKKHLISVRLGEKIQNKAKTTGIQKIITLEPQEIIGRWIIEFGGQQIHSEERPIRTEESVEAAAILIRQATILPGAYKILEERLLYTELYFQSRNEKPPKDLKPDSWLLSKLKDLGLVSLKDLSLISTEDLLPKVVDPSELQTFQKIHPLSLSLRDRTLRLNYDFSRRKVFLIHTSGRTSPPPSLFHLPKWPGWQVYYQVHSRKWNIKS